MSHGRDTVNPGTDFFPIVEIAVNDMRRALDNRQDAVEIMRDAVLQVSHRLHLLAVEQFTVNLLELASALLHDGFDARVTANELPVAINRQPCEERYHHERDDGNGNQA